MTNRSSLAEGVWLNAGPSNATPSRIDGWLLRPTSLLRKTQPLRQGYAKLQRKKKPELLRVEVSEEAERGSRPGNGQRLWVRDHPKAAPASRRLYRRQRRMARPSRRLTLLKSQRTGPQHSMRG